MKSYSLARNPFLLIPHLLSMERVDHGTMVTGIMAAVKLIGLKPHNHLLKWSIGGHDESLDMWCNKNIVHITRQSMSTSLRKFDWGSILQWHVGCVWMFGAGDGGEKSQSCPWVLYYFWCGGESSCNHRSYATCLGVEACRCGAKVTPQKMLCHLLASDIQELRPSLSPSSVQNSSAQWLWTKECLQKGRSFNQGFLNVGC